MIHNIYIGADHGGVHLKSLIKNHLSKQAGYRVEDLGTDGDDSVDYPFYADKVAEKVLESPDHIGILICGSGTGISMAANRHKGIRAAMCNTKELAQLAREHNGANILTLGGRTQNFDHPLEIVDTFLNTPMDGAERHRRRREQLDE